MIPKTLENPDGVAKINAQKKWVLTFIGLLFVLGLAWTLSRYDVFYDRADLIVRWYATGQLLHEGRDLYDLRNALEARQPFQPPGVVLTESIDRFYYPAHLIIFLIPLADLPYPVAHFIWLVATQLFYLLGIWYCMDIVNWPQSINQRTLFLSLCILFIPFLQQTIWAQFNTIAVLGLALSYQALVRGRYGWAGIWLVGLTFKPQSALLTLVFCLFWAIWHRERWRLIVGFALTSLALWGIAEWFQPGWEWSFLASLNNYIPTASVIDRYWNPYQITTIVLCLLVLLYFFYQRHTPPNSPAFTNSLVLSLAVWFLIVPVIGMFHVLALPLAVIWLMASFQTNPSLYRVAFIVFLLIYFVGWVSFILGLVTPGAYGFHIAGSETAYKIVAPLVVGILALISGLPFRAAHLRPQQNS